MLRDTDAWVAYHIFKTRKMNIQIRNAMQFLPFCCQCKCFLINTYSCCKISLQCGVQLHVKLVTPNLENKKKRLHTNRFSILASFTTFSMKSEFNSLSGKRKAARAPHLSPIFSLNQALKRWIAGTFCNGCKRKP